MYQLINFDKLIHIEIAEKRVDCAICYLIKMICKKKLINISRFNHEFNLNAELPGQWESRILNP